MDDFEFVELKVPDLSKYSQQLAALAIDIQRNIVRGAIRAAANVFRAGVLNQVPVRQTAYPPSLGRPKIPGLLKRSIYAGRSRETSAGKEVWVVRAHTGGAKSKDAFYWRWIEAGHIKRPAHALGGSHSSRRAERQRQQGGGGFVQGRFFFRYAFNSLKSRALQVFVDRLDSGIARANRTLK